MSEKRALKPTTQSINGQIESRTASKIASLRDLPLVDRLSYYGLKTVVAIRVLALCGRAGRDPLLELTQRFACVTTAKAFIAFADQAGLFWPEDVHVMRPCCRTVSPDELTMAMMLDAAAIGDRERFCQVIDGLVRKGRHGLLYDSAVELASVMQ